VFISNLDFNTTWTDVKDFMRAVGKVVRADIFRNKEGQSRGMGVVEFENQEDAEQAISELSGQRINGRKCFIKPDNTVMLPRE
jgi:RNA recognition motif-containing protein